MTRNHNDRRHPLAGGDPGHRFSPNKRSSQRHLSLHRTNARNFRHLAQRPEFLTRHALAQKPILHTPAEGNGRDAYTARFPFIGHRVLPDLACAERIWTGAQFATLKRPLLEPTTHRQILLRISHTW